MQSQEYYKGLIEGLRMAMVDARVWHEAALESEDKFVGQTFGHSHAEGQATMAGNIVDSIQNMVDFYEERHGQKLLQNVEASDA